MVILFELTMTDGNSGIGGGGGGVALLVNGEPVSTTSAEQGAGLVGVPAGAGPCTVAAAIQKLKEEEKKVQLVSLVTSALSINAAKSSYSMCEATQSSHMLLLRS